MPSNDKDYKLYRCLVTLWLLQEEDHCRVDNVPLREKHCFAKSIHIEFS